MILQTESLSRHEIDEIVDRKIRTTTRLAYDHNEFIHNLFRKAQMNPHNDINGRRDLLKAARNGVRTRPAEISLSYADYIEKIPTFEVWSSGSSGTSKRILRSPDELARISRGQIRGYRAAGVEEGKRILAFPGPPPYGSSMSLVDGLKTFNVRSLIFSVTPAIPYLSDLEKARLAKSYIEVLKVFNPDFVRAGAWQAKWFPRFLSEYGFDKSELNVESIIFSGDPTPIEERQRIGELWNAEPFDVYVSSEVSIISYECKKHMGMHLNEMDVFTSVIDPETGEECSTGEEGMDVVTPLFEANELPATTIINYSHGDHIKILPESCACGLLSALMSHPTRDTRKKPLQVFDLQPPRQGRSLFRRALSKARRGILR